MAFMDHRPRYESIIERDRIDAGAGDDDGDDDAGSEISREKADAAYAARSAQSPEALRQSVVEASARLTPIIKAIGLKLD